MKIKKKLVHLPVSTSCMKLNIAIMVFIKMEKILKNLVTTSIMIIAMVMIVYSSCTRDLSFSIILFPVGSGRNLVFKKNKSDFSRGSIQKIPKFATINYRLK